MFSQFQDNFSDGDYTSNPTWTGNSDLFVVENEQLRSNSPGANTYYLSTPSTLASDARWEFFFNMRFATSGANYVDVYLMADNEDLLLVQNGYFVRIGNTSDEVSLYSLVNGVATEIIDGIDNSINSSSTNPFNVRVKRSLNDVWTLETDDGATGNFFLEGSIIDNSVNTSTHFGIKIIQSTAAGPINKHFFDNFFVGSFCQPTNQITTVNACETYLWSENNQTYGISGIYEEVYTNIDGCDSIISLNLTINNPSTGTESVSSCDSYLWSTNNSTYNQSGTYEAIIPNANGCDSTVTLNLIIIASPTPQIDSFSEICDTASTFLLTQGSPIGGYYTVNGVITDFFEPNTTSIGINTIIYTTENEGCEGSAQTTINVIECVETGVGIKEIENLVKLYPNPTSSTISISGLNSSDIIIIELFDISGKSVVSTKLTEIDLKNLETGFYQLVITTNSNSSMYKIHKID
jgi:hypothetical protein